jgi:hypothetical protein
MHACTRVCVSKIATSRKVHNCREMFQEFRQGRPRVKVVSVISYNLTMVHGDGGLSGVLFANYSMAAYCHRNYAMLTKRNTGSRSLVNMRLAFGFLSMHEDLNRTIMVHASQLFTRYLITASRIISHLERSWDSICFMSLSLRACAKDIRNRCG